MSHESGMHRQDDGEDPRSRRPKRRAPADPFLTPSPENCDLGFLEHDPAYLIHLVDHHESLRRLRESLVYDFMAGDDDSPERWDRMIAEASKPFVPRPWMLPADELREPGTIAGIRDHFPISGTNPELYDRSRRERMAANGQLPWVISVTLNPGRHDAESFLNWVNTRMVPDILKSARELTQTQFLHSGPGTAPRRRGIRPVAVRDQPRMNRLTDERLRERLFSLAAYQIRRSAEPGETMTATFERYLTRVPSRVDDACDLARFTRRVAAVNADSLAEWKARLGGARLRTAVENRRLRFV